MHPLASPRRMPLALVLAGVVCMFVDSAAKAADADPSGGQNAAAPSTTIWPDIQTYFDNWQQRVDTARATQPGWSSPLVTTTGLLEERLRIDTQFQHAGNGTDTTDIDGGKGLDLIVGDATEFQFAAAPYEIRTTQSGKGEATGFGDWPFFRLKERLFSSPEDADDYIVSAMLQTQVSTGIAKFSSDALTLLPTIAFGKGFGPLVFQGTFGAAIPTNYEKTLGNQVTGNGALQYHLWQVLWPQMEVNWTHFVDGQRDGKDQVFLTPGVVLGRLSLTEQLRFTIGAGYQFAVEPHFQPSPLLPAYNHAWLLTTRLSF
jgi:hypothetical protein